MAGTVEQVVNANREVDRTTHYEWSLEGAQAGMAFVFRDYTYSASQEGFTSNFRSASMARANASMLLPLANNLVDSYSINVGQNEIGGMGALGIAASGGAAGMNDILSSALGATESIGESLGSMLSGNLEQGALDAFTNARGYAGFVGRNLLDQLPGGADLNAGFGVGIGTAVNPHAALVFNGVGLKTHQFEWKLSPKNAREAATIRDMANRIRKASLPSHGTGEDGPLGRALLRYPDLVDIWFVGVNREYFYYFKPCLIQSFSVNYAPDGVALNRGGIPSSVSFTMQVMEAQIHTKEDYE